jgi:hypothetical protein
MRNISAMFATLALLVGCGPSYRQTITVTTGATVNADNCTITRDVVRIYDYEIPIPKETRKITVDIDVTNGNGTASVRFEPNSESIAIGINNNKLMR